MNTPPTPKDIDDALALYFDNQATPDVCQVIQDWLEADPANAQIFAEYGYVERMIYTAQKTEDASAVFAMLAEMEAAADAEIVTLDLDAGRRSKQDNGSPTAQDYAAASRYILHHALTSKPAKKLYAYAGVAAVLLLAFVLFNPWADSNNSNDTPLTDNSLIDPNKPAESAQPILRDQTVATLTAEHNALWAEGALAPGSELHPHQTLTLITGLAEITTQRGAVAILEAPCTIELTDSNNALRLHSGKLVGICETELSQGFVVKTDYADITDLGTEFGVNVANNQLTTTVFAGKVVLNTPGSAPQPVVANQTATLTDDEDGLDLAIEDQVAYGFTLRLPRTTTAEQVQSRATPIAAWDFFGSDTRMGIHSGDASTASGLQMTGFVGQWGTMPPHQGAIRQPDRSFITGEATGVSNGITLRWAVDGVGATSWAHELEDAEHALFGDYYYIFNPIRWGGSAIPWRIEGLTPGARYDLIFHGVNNQYHDGALIAINGHDAGNGVGAAATLDDENDANFMSVVADAAGMISGTFSALELGKHAAITGVQIGLLPGPGNPRPNTNP